MTDQYHQWLKLFGAIATDSASLRGSVCPRCEQQQLRAQYVASEADQVGYAAFWCQSCWYGIWVSRARVPAGWSYATFEEAEAGLIPSFVRIDSDGSGDEVD